MYYSHLEEILEHFKQVGCRPVHVCFFFERARAPQHFLLGKGHPMRKFCNFLLAEHFKGTKAMTRGHGGNHLCCLSEV